LNEVSRNVHKKEGAEASRRLSLTLALCDREIVENPSSEEEEPWREITVEKDLHVLAGAMKANAHYLISLDKKLIVNAHFLLIGDVPGPRTEVLLCVPGWLIEGDH